MEIFAAYDWKPFQSCLLQLVGSHLALFYWSYRKS
jgi:hypothetical protein